MPGATSIVFERATEGDAKAISGLLKTCFGNEITPKHTDVDILKTLIATQHCVFDVAIDSLLEGRAIVGVAWWYFHMPKDWSGDRKRLFEALFGPTSNQPHDYREFATQATQKQEFNEPLLVMDKVCIDKDHRNQRIAESLSKATFSWAVLHDVKVMLAVKQDATARLMDGFRRALSGRNVVALRYTAFPPAKPEGPAYDTLASRYGVNEPYPEEVKEAARKSCRTTKDRLLARMSNLNI